MTDKEYLESLDTVPTTDNRTVTIPLDRYNQLLESQAKLRISIALYKSYSDYDFKNIFGSVMELKEDKPDA